MLFVISYVGSIEKYAKYVEALSIKGNNVFCSVASVDNMDGFERYLKKLLWIYNITNRNSVYTYVYVFTHWVSPQDVSIFLFHT